MWNFYQTCSVTLCGQGHVPYIIFILAILGLFLSDSWIFSHIYSFISHTHTHTYTFLTYRHILLYFIILTFQSHYWVISRWFQPKTENQCLAYLYMLFTMLTYCIACCCSVAKLCLTPCNPMDYSTSGFLIFHCLPKFSQTHVHWVSDAIQPSHSCPLLPASLSALNLFQHQSLFQWVGSSYEMTKVLELQLQHQTFQWIFRVNFL